MSVSLLKYEQYTLNHGLRWLDGCSRSVTQERVHLRLGLLLQTLKQIQQVSNLTKPFGRVKVPSLIIIICVQPAEACCRLRCGSVRLTVCPVRIFSSSGFEKTHGSLELMRNDDESKANAVSGYE